jgi:hypothetical protein
MLERGGCHDDMNDENSFISVEITVGIQGHGMASYLMM